MSKAGSQGTPTVDVRISHQELGLALMRIAAERCGVSVDYATDWYVIQDATSGERAQSCIGSTDWIVSGDPKIAALVDAANVLRFGELKTIEQV